MVKEIKAYELRSKTKSELVNQLHDLKNELQTLRIAQVTGGAPARLAKIGSVRKSIARVLTVTNQITKSKLREKFAGEKFLPIDLRAKKTRAIRRRLTKEQAAKKTVKQAKKDAYFPKRVYAVRA
uniref:60S ribosomal protein L35 n=1 Tax=Spumella elongata TaxID=89044 RepID=A0A7S3GP80_9STRA|mmetsp:Transcript_1220/g.2026  ORF Transcript_1220/g.2026 Transcript_1220/m.2026 type:complete len:125 (+) Transcript_1220:36-410(+)|eukprot:CAMPEP_0184969712 /NCGR_PEP_ID=MMETSP1098-20130426/2402_1 /TAXON_ID=89044 /ORGANISM="Spumella elongata, Strain CCAP 955/1" /LENGTH=124 /DNA_ID=CAMNT_0027491523 /DNA_START=36 /DNA_END=410 /DNA_ORIENTATION=-